MDDLAVKRHISAYRAKKGTQYTQEALLWQPLPTTLQMPTADTTILFESLNMRLWIVKKIIKLAVLILSVFSLFLYCHGSFYSEMCILF